MFIFDAHLDLSLNALQWERDLRAPVPAIRAREKHLDDKPGRGCNTVSFPSMREGRVGFCVATQIARCTFGEEALQQYLLREIQNVYRSQSVTIDDKHVEIIVGQMLRKVQVEDAGDTDFRPHVIEFQRLEVIGDDLGGAKLPIWQLGIFVKIVSDFDDFCLYFVGESVDQVVIILDRTRLAAGLMGIGDRIGIHVYTTSMFLHCYLLSLKLIVCLPVPAPYTSSCHRPG